MAPQIRWTLLAAALLTSVACSDPAPQPPPGERASFDLAIEKRRVAISGDAIRAFRGQQVELHFTTDEPAVVHLHGYDVELSLEPGAAAVLRFRADRIGRFPLNAHRFGREGDEEPHEHDHDHDHRGGDDREDASGERMLLYVDVAPR